MKSCVGQNLAGERVGPTLMDYLAPLTALTALALPGCLSLTGRAAVISALRALPRLRELDLSGCVFLGDIGVARLAGACAPSVSPNLPQM